MSEANENKNRNLRSEIDYIRGEINSTRSAVDGIHNAERFSGKTVGATAVLITLFFLAFQIYNLDRVDEAIERAERRIAILTGGYVPKRTWLEGVGGKEDKTVHMNLAIIPARKEHMNYFLLEAEGQVYARIKGNTGRIIGHFAKIEGAALNYFGIKIDGKRDVSGSKILKAGVFSLEGRDDGVLISEEAPLNISYFLRRQFMTCEEADMVVDGLVKLDSNDTKLKLKPVFFDIGEPPSFDEFGVTFSRGSYPKCELLKQHTSRVPEMGSALTKQPQEPGTDGVAGSK